MTAATLTPETVMLARLREALVSSQWSGLVGNLLGAFPDDPQIVDTITERHGKEIRQALEFVASRVLHEVRAADLLPVPPAQLQGTGYLRAWMGVRHGC